MTAPIPVPLLQQWLPVVGGRVVAVNPGARSLKWLALEVHLGRQRVLGCGTIDGLTGPGDDETAAWRQELKTTLAALGPHRRVLVLPQHRVITTTVDVLHEDAAERTRYLESEARKLSGLGDDTLFLGYAALRPFGRLRHPYHMTLCKRDEIRLLLERFGEPALQGEDRVEGDPLEEVVTSAEALWMAFQTSHPEVATAVLVDLGGENTLVTIQHDHQGVHSLTFDGGSNDFTQAVVRSLGCSTASAEERKRAENLLDGPGRVDACAAAVGKWQGEVRRAVSDWLEDYPELGLTTAALPVYVSGGGVLQPGLVAYLNQLGGLRVESWPDDPDGGEEATAYRVGLGAARTLLGSGGPRVSLLPPEYRRERQRREWWAWVQTANVVMVLLVVLVLAVGTWYRTGQIQDKREFVRRTEEGIRRAEAIRKAAQDLSLGYRAIAPILQERQQSLEMLEVLSAVRGARTNQDFWYLLFGDAASYAAAPIVPPSTNPAPAAAGPGPSGVKREYVAELCIPADGDAARRVLSQVVTDLKRQHEQARVDVLPSERKRSVVDPRVFLSNHVYAVSIEMPTHSNGVASVELAPGPAPGPRPRGDRPGPASSTNR